VCSRALFLDNDSRPLALFPGERLVEGSAVGVAWVVVVRVVVPEALAAYPEVFSDGCLVPVDTVLNFVAGLGVVKDEALVVFSAAVHDGTEHVVCGKNSEKTSVKIFSVLLDVLAQHKDIVDIGSNHGGHVHDVLAGHHEEEFPVTAIHEALSDAVVAHEGFVVHAIVQEEEGGLSSSGADEFSLALEYLFDGAFVVVAVDEKVRDEVPVVVVTVLGA